jgi:PAS domain S-box-containing protein
LRIAGLVIQNFIVGLMAFTLSATEAPLDKITLQLKWHHQFQFAGYYAAQEKGYYRDAGFEVNILEGKPGIDVVKEVVTGKAQFGVGSSSLVLARKQGQPVVVLAAVFQHSPVVLIARTGAGINSVQDMSGKRLMLEKRSDELLAYLHKEGVSENTMTLVEHTFNPDDLTQGKVDCISAYQTDETYFFDKANFSYLTFTPRMGGIDFYGDNLFTSEDELKTHPDRVKAFREASMKGWKYAMQHPEEMADSIISRFGEGRGRAYLLYEARKMEGLIQPGAVEMGYMYPGRWQHIIDTYVELGLLPKGFSMEEGFLYAPEASARKVNHRLVMIIAMLGGLGVILGGTALVLFRLSLHLKREVTSRVKAESSLRDSEERFRTIFEKASDGVIVFSPEGKIIDVNEIFAQMHGHTRTELLDLKITDISAPDTNDLVPERMRRLLAGESLKVELTEVHKDGHAFETEATASLITFVGQPAILSFHRDISDRKRAEAENKKLQAQLQHAQKMESLGTLAGGIAHDMNNVLSSILGLASTHIRSQTNGSPLYRALDTICKAAERGGKTVKSLLNFARQSPADERVLDINQILQKEIHLFERTTLAMIRIELDLAADLRSIRGDENALSNAFMNLCINAVDAMPENGILTLRTRNVTSDWVEVAVEDTGTGMPKEVLEKALDPFFTTKEIGKGTGLGLTLVYRTVQSHRGQMEILSEPGHGTRVIIRFPTCEAEAGSSESTGAAQIAKSNRALKVLLVDDDPLIQNTLQAILGFLAHEVSMSPSGEDALAMMETGYKPDVVILDMNMPGLGGVGTLPRIRALLPTVPVILSTGRADQTALNLASTHPGVTLLPKPFGLRELKYHLGTLGFE